MKTIRNLFAAILAASLSAASAQEAAPEDAVGNEAAVEERSVADVVNDYLASKGYTEGENRNGDKVFYVAVGYGVIQAPLDSRSYADSRVNAFSKAMLDAKSKMAEYLEISIRTSVEHDYAEGSIGGNEEAESDPMSLSAKFRRLAAARIDEALRAEGIDPDEAGREARERVAKRQLNGDFFRKAVHTAARARIVGMQVMCSFEGVPAGGKGQIAVVAVWSPKLQSMALSISQGTELPTGVGKRPISEQIPTDRTVLLSTFGVQQKVDENGRLVLVAFGQAGAVSDSPTSANAARNKAKMQAAAAIREFAGETVVVATDAVNAESVEEFENAADAYEDVSAYSQRIRAVAEEMRISGIASIRSWEARHPLTGRMIYGTVCTWSPEAAAHAQSMKRTMDSAAIPGASAPVGRAPAPAANPNGTMMNRGSDADDDAF